MNAVLLEQGGGRQQRRPLRPLFLLGKCDSEILGGQHLQTLLLKALTPSSSAGPSQGLSEPFPGRLALPQPQRQCFIPDTYLCSACVCLHAAFEAAGVSLSSRNPTPLFLVPACINTRVTV